MGTKARHQFGRGHDAIEQLIAIKAPSPNGNLLAKIVQLKK